jgi:GT2 family glycosyltransferase
VSVVVCTRNRPEALAACLRSLADEPADEILVVDNGSTPPVAATGRTRVVVEPVVGLSGARNRGLAEATSDVVLFLDDDVSVHPGVVTAHASAYRSGVAAAGGVIRFASAANRPRWLDPTLDEWLSVVDRGPAPRDLDRDSLPFGANLSVDREAALAVGGFDPQLGRTGGNLRSGEEADLLERLLGAGGRVRWCPDAIVDHHIPAARLHLRWFIWRAWAEAHRDVESPGGREGQVLALRLLWTAVRPGGTPWPPTGPPPLPPRAAVELVRRVRLVGAATAVARR